MKKLLTYIFAFLFILSCGKPNSPTLSANYKTSSIINNVSCDHCVDMSFNGNNLSLTFNKKINHCEGIYNISTKESISYPTESQVLNFTIDPKMDYTQCEISSDLFYLQNNNGVVVLYMGTFKIQF